MAKESITKVMDDDEFLCLTAVTPSSHYNYVDIPKTQNGVTYSKILANIALNQAWILRAFSYNSTTFRIIVTNPSGVSIEQECQLTVLLIK